MIAALHVTLIVGLGTVFGPSATDRHNPDDRLACYRRPLAPEDRVIAHPTLPCRAAVLVCLVRTDRCAWAHVGDRGPRRAAVDLSPALARDLGHDGYETVLVVHVPGARPPPLRVASR